ncbi:MAG: hybrid sensor histidine kinase/response regulator [Herminiimonas sp.]|nr:hybrid sensor histidine kinase/response regulator [Herminiimonas sp.]
MLSVRLYMTSDSALGAGPSVASRIGRRDILRSILAMDEPGGQEDAGRHLALVVDDNLELLEAAAQLFEQHGFEVLRATDGEEAMEVLRRTPDIEVLFSDVVMPRMSGIQLGHQARRMVPGIKIILVSGYTSITVHTGQGTINDFDFVKKPYRFSDILKLLAKPN